MCYFLTFAVPVTSDAIESSSDLILAPHTNDLSGHAYNANLAPYSATKGHCSCDLVTIAPGGSRHEKKIAREVASYERKGWSKSKIERAASESRKSQSRPINPQLSSLLDQLLHKEKYLEMLVHFHSGPFHGDRFKILKTVSQRKLIPSTLDQLTEDTRYIWDRRKPD